MIIISNSVEEGRRFVGVGCDEAHDAVSISEVWRNNNWIGCIGEWVDPPLLSISTYPTWGKYRLFHPGVTQFQSQTVVSIKMTVCAQTVLAHTVCTKICTYYESHKVQIFSVAFSNLTV